MGLQIVAQHWPHLSERERERASVSAFSLIWLVQEHGFPTYIPISGLPPSTTAENGSDLSRLQEGRNTCDSL